VELSASVVADEAGQPICRMASFVDISERKRAERAMRAAQRKLMTAREEERRRLAGELHDSVGQGLIVLQLTLEAALAGRSESSIAEGVARTRAQCDALVQEVRGIGRGLYPATLESMGLEAALRQLARDFESQTEVVVQWSKHCRPGSMREDVDIALFRIGQEAVANAVRHGQAQRVELGLACPEGEAVFTVTNNGSGFDPDAAKGKGLGLTTMQERAEAIGGTFEIHSRPGQTIIRVRVPAELARRPGYEG
jgi:two-component system NarL family sensor kinase